MCGSVSSALARRGTKSHTCGWVWRAAFGVRKGWLFSGRIKCGYTREDTYFTDLGYDNNPTLSPGKRSVCSQILAPIREALGRHRLSGQLPLQPVSSYADVGGIPQATAYQPPVTCMSSA
jgi:hypothetical protein